MGVFALEFITLTHSIPEPNAIVIRTASGTILHTGDWKFDPDPLLGENADQSALTRLGDEGVLAMVCDLTNALLSGRSGSEGDVRKALRETVAPLKGRVALLVLRPMWRGWRVRRSQGMKMAAKSHWLGGRCGVCRTLRGKMDIWQICRHF